MAKTKPPTSNQYDRGGSSKKRPAPIKDDPMINSIQAVIFRRFVSLFSSCKWANLACLDMVISKIVVVGEKI